jgi:hypothetical protein
MFTVAGSNRANHPASTKAIHAYLRWRNANVRHPDALPGRIWPAPNSRRTAEVRERHSSILWPVLGWRTRPLRPGPARRRCAGTCRICGRPQRSSLSSRRVEFFLSPRLASSQWGLGWGVRSIRREHRTPIGQCPSQKAMREGAAGHRLAAAAVGDPVLGWSVPGGEPVLRASVNAAGAAGHGPAPDVRTLCHSARSRTRLSPTPPP